MKRLLGLLACFVPLLTAAPGRAQLPLGTTVVFPDCTPAKILADPVRARMYVADPVAGRLLVVNTNPLQLVLVSLGSTPVDLALSPDNSTLYVANHGSAQAAVSVVDLDSLTVRATLALPGPPRAVAAGLEGRVYAIVEAEGSQDVCQFDGATGAVEFTFVHDIDHDFEYDFLRITPDGKTLLVAGGGTLASYDVSAAAPVAVHTRYGPGSGYASQPVVSHDGRSFCWPGVFGDSTVVNYDYGTDLLSTADIEASYGTFDDGFYGSAPGPLAFSPDDRLVYQSTGASEDGKGETLRIFDTASFAQTNMALFPTGGSGGDANKVASMVVDRTGSYLFVGETTVPTGSLVPTAGRLAMVATGVGTLALPLPTVTLTRAAPEVANEVGQVGEFILTLSDPAPGDLRVAYKVTGTAFNGSDYTLLKGTAKVRAGQTTKAIKVKPQGGYPSQAIGAPPGTLFKSTVALTLEPGAGYLIGTFNKVKIKIVTTAP